MFGKPKYVDHTPESANEFVDLLEQGLAINVWDAAGKQAAFLRIERDIQTRNLVLRNQTGYVISKDPYTREYALQVAEEAIARNCVLS